jgi:histone acetyltransferase (RNA polymerase elongator complex component)
LIIPVFIPHAGCPHRCVFCDQTAITAASAQVPSERAVCAQIDAFLARRSSRRGPVEIAFFGGNALGLSNSRLNRLLAVAAQYVADGRAQGIRLSTRPDTVTAERLDELTHFPVRTIELGVQSLNDAVLRQAGRGHSAHTAVVAVELLKRRGLRVGVQLMLGLPGDDADRAMATGAQTIALQPDFVRLYPTLVLAGSPLAALFARGDYRPLSLEEAIHLAKRLYIQFARRGLPVIRMGLQQTDTLNAPGTVLGGPLHPAFGELVLGACFRELALMALGAAVPFDPHEPASIRINPRSESRLRGYRGANMPVLERAAGRRLKVMSDPLMDTGAVAVGKHHPVHLTDLGAPE